MQKYPFQPKLLFKDIAFRLFLLVFILDWTTKAYFALTLTNKPCLVKSSVLTWDALVFNFKLIFAPFVMSYYFSNLHFGLFLCYHSLPLLDYLACAVIIASIIFCYYLIGCNRFFIRKTMDRIIFGLIAGGAVANALDVLLTGRVTDWLRMCYFDVDILALYEIILNFADIVLFIAVPIAVVLILVRVGIYLFSLKKGQP